MAKSPAAEQIQAPDKMKPLLALSKQEPVSAAIALTGDGEGLILLDKRAKPKKVRAMLRAAAAKAKIALNNASIRFGRAEVDTDYDSGMVRFFVNKETPGNMRPKLVEVVKRIPYQKVEINVDPSLENDPEEDEGQEGAAEEPVAASEPAMTQSAAPPPPEAPPPPPPPPPPPGEDEHALKLALAGLIQRIPAAAGADANRKATLLKIAGLANDQLKAHNLEVAGKAIAQLRQVIDAAAPTGRTGGGLDPAKYAAARAAWQEAIEAVDAQVTALQQVLRGSGDEDLEEIAEFGLNAVTANHKVPLMAALMEIGLGTPSAEALAKSGPKALAAVQAFRAHIDSDERVAACDESPEAPTAIRATLGPALSGLEAALAA